MPPGHLSPLALSSLLLAIVGCASGAGRFPLRESMWRDTDLKSRSVPCRPDPDPPEEDPGHKICRPDSYESSFAWDGADNILFRPFVRFFAVDPRGEAVNVNAFDETPDSAWFTNRIGRAAMSDDEIMRGPCGDEKLDPDSPDGSWLIDQGKPDGANPGFRIRTADGRKYMLKSDLSSEPERATGATAIAARLYHAAGWYSACDSVVYIKPSILVLKEGLKYSDNTGATRAFDKAKLEFVLGSASRRGDRIRFVASRWLPGRAIGPFTYSGVRPDDPNDIIPHQDRRDLRGARLIAAWLNHFDSREQNTMSVWLADNEEDPDSSPGHTIQYYLDFGDSFGSKWTPDAMHRRLGHSYYFDFGETIHDFLTLGFDSRPWDRAHLSPDGAFGYYRADDFDPEAWKGGYPNPTFQRMTERDGAWAARIIARFTDGNIATAVKAGDYTNPGHTAFLTEQLIARRDKTLRRYLSRVSPVTDLVVESGELCGVDLARKSGLWRPEEFRYRARARVGQDRALRSAAVRALPDGRVCIALPRLAEDAGARDDHPTRYLIVDLLNGQATGMIHAHLYDLGPTRGHVLVGIERDVGGRK